MIGLRDERDVAVDRFLRSLKVFGYRYRVAHLSAHGRLSADVAFDKKVRVGQKS